MHRLHLGASARRRLLPILTLLFLAACSGGGSGGAPVGGSPAGGVSTGIPDDGAADAGAGSAGAGDAGTVAGDAPGGGDPAGEGAGGGAGGSGGATGPFAVANPYARPDARTVADVRVGRAIVFGDSYSSRGPRPFDPWPRLLRREGLFADLDSYARGGATAGGSGYKSFTDEVDSWEAADGTFREGDLTLVYLGYNDIASGLDLDRSKSVMGRQLERLRSAGATADERRLFVMLLHDWSRNPGGRPEQRAAVESWNRYLVDYANGRKRVIAVDLFTLFERVFADPGRFGFTNVTTADPDNADSTALYYDNAHFGAAGQDLIARLVEHYLTRAWDWSNSLSAGSQSAARLEQDIDDGLLAALALTAEADRPPALFAFSVGRREVPERTGTEAPFVLPYDEESTAFRAQPVDGDDGGIAWRLSPRTTFALAFARADETLEESRDGIDQRASVLSDAVGLELRSARGPLRFRTHALWTRDRYEQRLYDGFFDETERALADGTSWSVGQAVSWPHRLPFGELAPWADITLRRQSIAAYSIADPYLGEVRFGASEAYESLASVGLALSADPIPLASSGELALTASLGFTRSLSREDWKVEITEGLATREETVARGPVERIEAGAGLSLRLGDALALSASYGLTRDAGSPLEHALSGSLRYRF